MATQKACGPTRLPPSQLSCWSWWPISSLVWSTSLGCTTSVSGLSQSRSTWSGCGSAIGCRLRLSTLWWKPISLPVSTWKSRAASHGVSLGTMAFTAGRCSSKRILRTTSELSSIQDARSRIQIFASTLMISLNAMQRRTGLNWTNSAKSCNSERSRCRRSWESQELGVIHFKIWCP